MLSTKSGASYNPSISSQKCHRCDYDRIQSATEGQGSVDDHQINKLCHYEADNTVLSSNRAETTTKGLIGDRQSQPEGLQQCISEQRVPDPFRSVENCMNSYLTVGKFLGHPNTCKLLNGRHPLMEKKNMMLLTAEWRKKQPSTTQESAKNSPSSQNQQFQHEKSATSSEQGQRKGTSHKALQPGLPNPKDSA
ncbi:hypothetical protein O181_073865 [Austropuccinia psidii MF-1]|uniref:Uncharacterized protein n=1 Tax=Austropuccinia psidii MF-1 TaxID=1389203 RepID=A0A9Q3F3E9_9BASI|nr:hypothetical protein [Austropuccinia psidii MF-1]